MYWRIWQLNTDFLSKLLNVFHFLKLIIFNFFLGKNCFLTFLTLKCKAVLNYSKISLVSYYKKEEKIKNIEWNLSVVIFIKNKPTTNKKKIVCSKHKTNFPLIHEINNRMHLLSFADDLTLTVRKQFLK